MGDQYIALVIAFLIFVGSVISVETGISVALIEITLGVIGGNFLELSSTSWLTFIANFGGILLTFLAGAEVDLLILREKAKEGLLIGGLVLGTFPGRDRFLLLGCPLESGRLPDRRDSPFDHITGSRLRRARRDRLAPL